MTVIGPQLGKIQVLVIVLVSDFTNLTCILVFRTRNGVHN